MTAQRTTGHAADRGFSLIEFMIALLLGTILIGGAISVYLASSRSFQESERSIRLLDNGRFALQILVGSLRHTGFFAGLDWHERVIESHPALGSVQDDCNGEIEAQAYGRRRDDRRGAFLFATVADDDGNALGCITDAQRDSDVLVVKALVPAPLTDADPNDPTPALDGVLDFPSAPDANAVYLLTGANNSPNNNRLVKGSDVGNIPGGDSERAQLWPYSYQVFYVRRQAVGDDVIHTLARKRLEFSGGALRVGGPEDLVRGIEDMRVRFRYDSDDGDDNCAVDTAGYADDGVTDYPLDDDPTNWSRIGSVELFLLVRNLEEDFDYLDEKTYTLGDRPVTPNDNFWRLLVDQHINVRNPYFGMRRGCP